MPAWRFPLLARRRLLLTLPALAIACRAEPEAWQLVAPDGGRFSIEMPVRPRTGTQRANTSSGPVEVRFYEVEVHDGAVVYSVTHTDYPPERIGRDKAGELLAEARSTMVKQLSGAVSSDGETSIQGYPARRTTVRAGTGVEYDLLVVLAGARLYQVSTTSRPGRLSAADRARFVRSFRLVD